MEDKKTHQLKLDNDYYVCLANELILAKQKSMSIWACRIINFLVMQLDGNEKLSEDTKVHTVRITELAKFIDCKDKDIYAKVYNALDEIMSIVITIGDKKNPQAPWKKFHWVSRADHDGKGNLLLALSDEIKPYLYELKSRGFFTQYQIKEILSMNSFYAITLYQYITMIDNKYKNSCDFIELSISELRELLECTDKFKQIGQLKEKVIERAVTQINNNCNSKYWLEIVYIKPGKVVESVRFYIHEKNLRKVS